MKKLFNKDNPSLLIKQIFLIYLCVILVFAIAIAVLIFLSSWFDILAINIASYILTSLFILFILAGIILLIFYSNLHRDYKNVNNEITKLKTEIINKQKHEEKINIGILFNSIIEGIPLPILIINENKEIVNQNDSFVKIFMKHEQNKEKHTFQNLFWNKEFYKFIDNLVLLETNNNNIILELNSRFYKIIAFRAKNHNDVVHIIIFEDITHEQILHKKEKEFVSNVSHELKTPISALLLAVDIINETNTNSEIKEELDIINRQAKQMNNIISDLLGLSSPLNESVLLNLNNCSIKQILNETIVSLKHLWSKKHIKLIISGDDVVLEADFVKLIQVFTNIIKNAIFYSNEGGEIKCSISNDKNNALISIKDYGTGIQSKYFEKIFERFYCVNKDRSRKNGGSGLGLSIALELVQLHNGTIKVDSELNKWTEFTVIIPK